MVTAKTPNGRGTSGVRDRGRVLPLKRRPTPQPLPDVLHTECDDEYLTQLNAEAEWWDGSSETLCSDSALFGFQEYQNERLTGDRDRTWYETIADYGSFERGCVLGAGPGDVEAELLSKMPGLGITVHDISKDSLGRLEARLEAGFSGRSSFGAEDLNFVTLPEKTYDLIVSHSSIHHILNLEHLAYEVNRALTADGLFFLMDRVGESFYQFSDEKKRIWESYMRSGPNGPEQRVYWPEMENWHYSPFEGVRSGEILDIFGSYLNQMQLRTSSSLIELMLFVGPKAAPPGSRSFRERATGRVRRELFKAGVRLRGIGALATPAQVARGDLLMQLDGLLCDSGALQPGLAFAVYRKRT